MIKFESDLNIQRNNLSCVSDPVVDPDGDLGGSLPVVHLGDVQRGVVLTPVLYKYCIMNN